MKNTVRHVGQIYNTLTWELFGCVYLGVTGEMGQYFQGLCVILQGNC